jgi:catechol 2,3-dioxygenase-like lactoylglutathione lyase family enzyme
LNANRSPIAGFSHVAIVCTNLDEARDFYIRVLGLTELPRPDFGIPGMWLRAGDLQLHFIENASMPIPGPGFPHFALHVDGDHWDEVMNKFKEDEVSFLSEPSERNDFGIRVRAAFVIDPSGNVVELTDVGPLPA